MSVHVSTCQYKQPFLSDPFPSQNKEHFKKFMDSVLKNITKLKTLHREIKFNYTNDSSSSSIPYFRFQAFNLSHGVLSPSLFDIHVVSQVFKDIDGACQQAGDGV